ncbi:MAG: rubredoxin-like domain-containing protein [Candidatus Odinarchaeota archaeon]
MLEKQYVCLNCGYNMINFYPEVCPFCGAPSENFITAEKAFQNYKILITKVNDKVSRLNSYPSIGLEHSAYCLKTQGKNIWIDCPSIFNKDLEPMDKIIFTHNHFLGASNLYRNYYTAFIWIHKKDSEHPLAIHHPFDKKFEQKFKFMGIEAFHINGHTPGFTFYIFEKTLFICDYVILRDQNFILNPYGPFQQTKKAAQELIILIKNMELDEVCGFNYVMDYQKWKKKFLKLISSWY